MSQNPASRPQQNANEQAVGSTAAPAPNPARESGSSDQAATDNQKSSAVAQPQQGGSNQQGAPNSEGQHHYKPRNHSRDFQNRRNSYTKHHYNHHHNNNSAGGHNHHNNNGTYHHHNNNSNSDAPHFRGPRNQGYPRYNNHTRGPSFQAPPMYGGPAIMDAPMYSPMYPVYDSSRFGHPQMAAQPQFVHSQQPALVNRKVVMTDANGNPIDLKEKLKHTRTHSSSESATPTPKDLSPAAPAPAAAPRESSPAKPESIPEFTKPAGSNDVAQKMKELIALKRQKRLAAEAGSEQPKEQSKEPEAQPKVAEPKAAEPAAPAAEPKVAEPKAAEPKAAEPKAAEPKAAEPKAAEPKAAEPKAAEPKAAEPKVAEPTTAEPKTAEVKTESEPETKEQAKPEPQEVAKAEPSAEATKTEQKAPEPKEEPKPSGPAPGKWIPPFLRRKAEAEAQQAAKAAAEPKAEESKPETPKEETPKTEPPKEEAPKEEAPKADTPEAPSTATAKTETAPKTEATKTEPKVESNKTEAAKEENSKAEASKEEAQKENASKTEKFQAQMATAHRPTPEELNAFKYPSNVLANPEAGQGHGYRYSPDFLIQFAERVPRAYYDNFSKVLGFEYQSGVTRWGSGMGGRGGGMSSRGPSRSGSHVGFGGPGGRGSGGRNGGSVRGRNNSRRKGDRQGSRRDREEANINTADLPPLHKVENAWTPSFAKKQQEEAKEGDDNRLSPEEVQRKVKSLLNKMAWENFDQIASQIREIALQSINENNAVTLRQVIHLTFDKAIDEPHWSEIYAAFFLYLHLGEGAIPPEVVDESDPEKILKGVPVLRRYLLNMSQQEFEKGWGEITQLSGNVAMMSDEYYHAIALKRRGLGLTQLIGELLKKGLVSEKLVMGCFARLAMEEPTEDIVESMSKLIRTVATTMIRMGQGNVIDMAMGTLSKWKETGGLPARLRFKIMDMEDLGKKKWAGVDDSNGPKTIAQVHLDALKKEQEAEREKAMKSRQSSRRGGDFGRSSSGRSRK